VSGEVKCVKGMEGNFIDDALAPLEQEFLNLFAVL